MQSKTKKLKALITCAATLILFLRSSWPISVVGTEWKKWLICFTLMSRLCQCSVELTSKAWIFQHTLNSNNLLLHEYISITSSQLVSMSGWHVTFLCLLDMWQFVSIFYPMVQIFQAAPYYVQLIITREKNCLLYNNCFTLKPLNLRYLEWLGRNVHWPLEWTRVTSILPGPWGSHSGSRPRLGTHFSQWFLESFFRSNFFFFF